MKNAWNLPAAVGQSSTATQFKPGLQGSLTAAAAVGGSNGVWGDFKDILQSEAEQSESYERARAKPLYVTQAEEKAIEELKEFYNVDNVFDELISVVRVGAGPMATPVWKKF